MSKRLWPAAAVFVLFGSLFAQQLSPRPSKSFIRDIRFVNAVHLSPLQKAEILEEFRNQDLPEDASSRSLASRVEHAVAAAYADKGYWKSKLKATASFDSDSSVSVVIHVSQEGRQYRLGDLQWKGIKAYPEAELSEMIPLRGGGALQRSKIAEGMDAVRRLYLADGYLGCIAVPEIETNDRTATADLRINVDEGGVFTVRGFDIVGLDTELRERLLRAWPFKPGDIYRGESVENFLNSNAPLLPGVNTVDSVCRTVDLSGHTIEFLLDFRPQPACASQPDATREALTRLHSTR